MTRDMSDVLLRFSIGRQNTISLSEFKDDKFKDFVSLSKLSILSFQKRFPGARFVALYNGTGFPEFKDYFDTLLPKIGPVDIIDQVSMMDDMVNPYHFSPRGVWWKWLPFRLDISKHEIAIDTDIICINYPENWCEWLDGTEELILAPERYEKVSVNTCGDFAHHPVLRDKKPLNCGIVGQRAGHDFAERFFEVTKDVKIGSTHNSLFITEQGSINVWVRSLERDGIKPFILDFAKNAWMRDFLYFMHRGTKVETIHAVSWYKQLIRSLYDVFERKILHTDYTDDEFFVDLLRESIKKSELVRFTLARQLGPSDLGEEFDFVR